MADVKISALPPAPALTSSSIFAIVEAAVTYKADITQVAAAFPTATALVTGLLSSADWTTFSNKLSPVTALTAGSILFAGATGQVDQDNAELFWDNANNRLGIGTNTPSAFKVDINGTVQVQERFTLGNDSTPGITQTSAVIAIDSAITNANIVLRPNGTGAIVANIPDNAVAGGNARGDNAVDFQTTRFVETQVASGLNSSILGGSYNTASGGNSFIGGGVNNTASADSSSISGGRQALAYLWGQRANAIGSFSGTATGCAQTSSITLRRVITGTGIATLSIDGSGTTNLLILALPTGATNARVWRGRIDLVAIVTIAGTASGVLVNDTFSGSYEFCIRRTSVAGSATLIGTPAPSNEMFDTSMATSVVTISADTANGALRLQFTPPTTAVANTEIRVVATAYLTEVGR